MIGRWKTTFILLLLVSFLPLPAIAEVGLWNGFFQQKNVIECINHSNSPLNTNLEIIGSNGQLIGELKLNLSALETRHILLNDFSITDDYGTYQFQFDSEISPELLCHTMVYRLSNGIPEYAYSLPVGQEYQGTQYGIFNSMDPALSGLPVLNWLTLVNRENKPETFTLSTYDTSGGPLQLLELELAAGQRSDIPLGHPRGQTIGSYRIAPTNAQARYGALLMRYKQRPAGSFEFAFPVFPEAGASSLGPLPVSSMGAADNWVEIANFSAQEALVRVQIRDADGTTVLNQEIVIPANAQHHLLSNQAIGMANRGTVMVETLAGEGLLGMQSLFYGRGNQETSWAYAKQQSALSAPPGAEIVTPYNTSSAAANWYRLVHAAGDQAHVPSNILPLTGTTLAQVVSTLSVGGTTDIGIHQYVGINALGFVSSSVESQNSLVYADSLRVFPDRFGGIAAIALVPSHISLRSAISKNSHFRSDSDSQCRPADVDLDGKVNHDDLKIVLGAWGTSLPQADIVPDGVVSAGDLARIFGCWGFEYEPTDTQTCNVGSSGQFVESFNQPCVDSANSQGIFIEDGMLRIELQSSRQVLPAGTLAHLDFNGDLSEQQGNFDTECHLGACNLSQSFAGQGQALTTAFSSRDDSAIRLTTRLPTNETELEEFSLSGWVYLQPESISYERQLISGTATDWFSLLISGGDSAGASRKLATYYGTNKSRTPIMLADVSYEKWTHFTVVMQRGEQNLLQVYIDGEHVNSVPAHTTRAFASKYDFSTMLVGRAAAGSERSIDGSLDDLMLHERALSQEEIRAMIGSEATGVYRSAPIQLAGPPTSVGLNLIGQNLEHVTVRLSTDRGANWCEFAENNSYLGTFRFEDAQRNFGSIDCYLPITLTNELLYEIEIAGPPAKISDVQIDELQLEIDYGIPACADGIDNDGDGFDGQADFGCQSHLDQAEEDTTGALELGINLAPVADWDTSLVWVDAFKSNRAWMTIADNVVSWGSTNLHRLALNENGYPTHLPQSVGGKQYKLHTLMLREIAGQYPSGEYRLHCAGNGEIELRFAASGQFNCPSPAAGYPVTVDGSSGAGVWLIMNRSSATNPIRRINFILPEYREPTSGQVLFNGRDFHSGNPNLPYFHPRFLEKLQGFHTIRFMDWQRTNNSELTHWSERRLISDASQAGPRVRSMPIVSISTQAPIAGALLGNHPLVRIETAIPHGLSSGQTVGFLKNNQEHTPRHRNYVHVIDATRFAMRRETLEKLFYLRTACNDGADNDNDGKKDYGSSQANDPGCDSVYDDSETSITQPVDRRVCRFDSNIVEVVPEGGTQSLSSISACVSGAETMFRLDPGVALEHQIDLINVLTASGWFHIPHLATKDYVEQFAQLIATRTDFSNPNTRIYLEYSNEAPWQGGFFSQGNWLSWKADSDPAFRALENKFDTARYYAYRTAQVFQWFETAFTAAGGDMGRVIRVLGGQAGSKWIGEQEFKHLAEFWSHTPESKVVDAYTIAGYCCGIGVDKSAIPFSQLIEQNLSPEALLDETFDRLDQRFHENETAYNEHAALAKEYGVTLLAYEGGQHLVPITEPHKSVESRNVLTKVWGAAQNDSRMYDMYTNNLRAWTDAGGGLFMHFSSFGKHSSWGMWGALEGVLQDDHQGPKYCFMRERLDGYGGEGSCHTRFAQPELGAPHCSNGIDDDGDGLVDSADPQCSNSQDVLESS